MLPPALDGLSFEESSALVLGRLKAALTALLAAANAPVGTASEVERAFGIDYKLAWQIHRIATSPNPLGAGEHVPARVSITKLLKAAARRRIAKDTLDEVASALDDFESLMAADAADREELETMLAAFVPEAREKQELEIKRAAFRAQSQIKGVTMEAQVGAFLLHPSSDGRRADRATFSAYLGLRRLRPAAHIGFTTISTSTTGAPVLTLDGTPPDDVYSILLREYCSQPPPRFNATHSGQTTLYSVSGDNVGLRSAVDLVMAEHRPSAMRRFIEEDGRRISGVINSPDLPMKRQTTDIFLHRDVYPDATPNFGVYDVVPRGMVPGIDEPTREMDRLPFRETLHPIEGGMLAAGDESMSHIPRYVQMLRHICAKLGWNPAEFRGFRLDVQYPVYGGQYMIGFPLPPRPTTP